MKTKHFLFAMALPSLFAACTQEELVGYEAGESAELAKRPSAGVVEFTIEGNEPETRFNHELGKFDNGETIDLYLMDELVGHCDDGDANHMHGYSTSVECWKYFNVWDELYSLKNYTQTRYPFAYDANSETWKNCATLLEGNYFAMHPSNDKITNRKDVWHYINPVQGFSKDGEFYKLAMDNQFWLGYTPVYRDEDRTGEMTLPLSMQPIMTVLKLNIGNKGNTDVIVDKIVFKGNLGQALPTIAYVRPATEEEWRKTVEVENPMTADGCGPLQCNKQDLNTEYSRELTWPSTSVGRGTARNIVVYETPAEHKPYGLEDTNVAYEYVFNFDEDSELGGHFLKGNVNNGEYVTVYFPLPHDLGETKLEPVIYGRIYDKPNNTWKYGILRKGDFTADNGSKIFTLDQANLKKLQPYVQEVTAAFDEMAFEAINDARVQSTEDLMRYLKGLETSYTSQNNFNIYVNVYGNGLVINDEVISYLDEMNSKKDCFIKLNFNALDNKAATVILDTEKDCMQHFNFYNGTIDFIVSKGNHSLEEANQVLKTLTIEEPATFNIQNEVKITETINEGVLNVAATIKNATTTIENHNIINLMDGADIKGKLINEATANVIGTATVNNLRNYNECVNCGKDIAVLTITSEGSLTVTSTLNNYNKVVNDGSLVVNIFLNQEDAVFDSNATSTITALTNEGTVNVNEGTTTLTGTSGNKALIEIAAGAKLDVFDPAVLNNWTTGTINVRGDLMDNIKNSGYVYVIENGHVGVNGIYEESIRGIIDVTYANASTTAQQAKDQVAGKAGNYFRYDVRDESVASKLIESLKTRISSKNWNENRVIVRWTAETTASTFLGSVTEGNIQRIIIAKDLTFEKNANYAMASFEQLSSDCTAIDCNDDTDKYLKAFVIEKGVTVTVANGTTLKLVSPVDDYIVKAWVDGTVSVNNSAKLYGNVKVSGAGRFEFDTKMDFVNWTTTGLFTGQWNIDEK